MAWPTPASFTLGSITSRYLLMAISCRARFVLLFFQNFENRASGTCSRCMIIVLSCFSSFKRIWSFHSWKGISFSFFVFREYFQKCGSIVVGCFSTTKDHDYKHPGPLKITTTVRPGQLTDRTTSLIKTCHPAPPYSRHAATSWY